MINELQKKVLNKIGTRIEPCATHESIFFQVLYNTLTTVYPLFSAKKRAVY